MWKVYLRMGLLSLLATASQASAGAFTFARHIASGEGTANVFDGGPPITVGGSLGNPNLEGFSFLASDFAQPGSFGGTASSSGRSQIVDLDQGIRILVNFNASYSPSLFPNGDRPGGESEGWLSSVIEFEMPADELLWSYRLLIRETPRYTGSASVLFENVTRGETILSLTEDILPVQTVLSGTTGDLIRVTTEMSGAGSAPADIMAVHFYTADLATTIRIPEPSTTVLLALGAPLLLPRRHKSRHPRL